MYERLQIGKIVNTHGVRGEVKLIPLTDDPRRFDDLEWVYIEKDSVLKKHFIENIKYIKNTILIKFSGIDSMDCAESYKNCFVLIDRENAVVLPEDTYFICDLIGLDVFDEKGALLGRLSEVLHTGSNDVYVVKDGTGREILLPALKSVVREVSPDDNKIEVIVPKGLLDDEV